MTETSPAEPRLAATVLIVRDDPLEVLRMRRPDRRGDAYASTLVFPGEVVEPEDRLEAWSPFMAGAGALTAEAKALRIAAIREAFEDTGVLIGWELPGTPVVDASFLQMVRKLGLLLPLDRLLPFAHWVTPEIAPKRFDTHFFLCGVDRTTEAKPGVEAVSVEWISPRDALRGAEAGAISIPFVTRMNLKRLSESPSLAHAVTAARARPAFTVCPVPLKRDGRTFVFVTAEAGYGITEGAV